MKRNNDVLFLRIPKAEREEIIQAAQEDQIYISEFVRDALRDALRERARRKRREEIRSLQLTSFNDQSA